MKKDIHPDYFSDAKIACACGTTLTIGSTAQNITVELCSACHPFYTGKQKLVDTAGRVEKFARRVAAKTEKSATRIGKTAKKEREAKKRSEKSKEA